MSPHTCPWLLLSFLLILKVVQAIGWVGAVTGRRLDFGAGWLPFAVVGATTVVGQLICLSVATPLAGTAMAAILVATLPLFSMVISQFWRLERATRQGLSGLALGFGGILLLVGFPAVPVTESFVLGCVASLFGSFFVAFGSNYVSWHLRTAGAWEVPSGLFLFGRLMTLPLFLVVPVAMPPRPVDFLFLLILGGVMTALTTVSCTSGSFPE
jgi:drug/metabolite transporter (DMT)-like permease